MNIDIWLAFVIASLVLVVTPGPSIFLGISHSINYGVRRTTFTALGDISANFIQMILVSVGLGIIISNSEVAFNVIKWLGVVTLFYMGIKLLFATGINSRKNINLQEVSNSKLYASGFIVAAGNPKAIVFFTAFFPQFIDTTQPIIPQMAIMCPTMAILDFSLVMLYAFSANKIYKTGKMRLKIINRVSGGILVAASGGLALSNR